MTAAPDQQSELTPLKRAFLAIEDLQARLAAAEQARHEPIAVIGLGCRLPGGVDGPEELWELLQGGVDAIGDIPADRWDVDAFYDPDVSVPGKMSTRRGGFLRAVDGFEPQLFGIAPREAAAMDPQQRLLLEVAWEALEQAGQAPARLAGTRTGVFVGINTNDYAQLTLNTQGVDGLGAYYASGIAHSIASGRLSYILGLEGPSISLDTACSSSLVAVHLAVQSLRSGESNLALAGGVNLMLSPEMSITLSKYQMMAPDGRCKFGDASADGFVRAEGCAVVVLKRLADARADGDRLLAVIRGTAINQDGASSGLTAPNGPAQEAVIRAALADGDVDGAAVSYVEAHGTGTALGDPIELQALGAAYGPGRSPDQPLLVGSVKTNLGHLEAAAGITGLCKLVVMLEHGRVPASLHFDTPSPHVPWEELPVQVPTELAAWEPAGAHRLAGLSSFGFSGTNVHVVVEQPPVDAVSTPAGQPERPLHVMTLSARTASALTEVADRHARHLAALPPAALADAAHTAATGRNHLAHRVVAVAPDATTAAAQLAAFAAGEDAAGLVHGHVDRTDPPKVAFLFTGQGAQHAGMGRGLYDTQPVFRAALDHAAAVLDERLERPLLELLFADPGSPTAALLDQTAYTQPALVALEHALATLWLSWGVTPTALLGHSVGEYTAAILGGVMTLDDGLALVAERGRLMQRLPTGGAMAAVLAEPEQVEAAFGRHGGELAIAARNGPGHTVVAGPAAAVDEVVARLGRDGVTARRLNVSHAFHSPLVEPVLDALETAARAVTLRPARLRLISNLSGAAAGAELADPTYWRRHAREAVRFGPGVDELARLGCDVLIEIGPHPTLLGMAQGVLPPGAALFLPSLRRGRDDWEQLAESVARLHVHGGVIDWEGFDRPYRRRTLALPTYPFERERHWLAPGRPNGSPGLRAGGHPLLGRRLRSPLPEVQFEQELCLGQLDYLDDHRVLGRSILPATGFIELALAAGHDVAGHPVALRDVELLAPLVVADEQGVVVQTIVTPDDDAFPFEVVSEGPVGEWQQHARGRLVPHHDTSADAVDVDGLRARCPERMDAKAHGERLERLGLDLGPSLRGVDEVWRGNGEVLAAITLRAAPGRHRLHPALLDGCLQVVAWLAPAEDTYLPIAIDQVSVLRDPGTAVWAHATLVTSGATGQTFTVDVAVCDLYGRPVAALRNVAFKRVDRDARTPHPEVAGWLYELAWRRAPLAPLERQPVTPMELADPASVAAAVARAGASRTSQPDLARHERALEVLDELTGQDVVHALVELGVDLAPRRRIDRRTLAIAPQHRRLLEQLLAGLTADGLLEAHGDTWVVRRAPEPVDDRAGRWAELAVDHPEAAGEIDIVERCGRSLADALRGETDPLELLFPGGSTASAEHMYRDAPLARLYGSLVADAAAVALSSVADEGRLRVLEIGGGTGSTTGHVLPRLPADRADYTFTDISPLFVARAEERFAEHAALSARTLDIEADPAAQGFALHQYDLVIATNVLHATQDLRRTLDNVVHLLAPGGLLLLLEMTTPHRYIDVSFGLTAGWWRFTDRDRRDASPLLDRDGWLTVLAEAGFTDVAAPELEAAAADLSLQTLFVACAPHAAPRTKPRSWLVFADRTGVGGEVAELLQARGDVVRVVEPDAIEPADVARLADEAPNGGWDGVVHLWSLDRGSDSLEATVEERTGSALLLVQGLLGRGAAVPRVWLVTRGAQAPFGTAPDPGQAPLWGFGRVVALEHPELGCTLVDLDPAPSAASARQLVDELTSADREPQVAFRGGARYAARLARAAAAAGPAPVAPRRVELPATGILDEIALRPLDRRPPGPGEVEIRVHAAGVNFRDVMNALAMRDDQEAAGSECAGVVAAVGAGVDGIAVGDAVVAVAPGCFASFVTAAAELVAPMPAGLTFEQAATLPLAFLTADDALHRQAGLRYGESVLIHAGAGGVGLAALQIARAAGARPFATASHAKRDHLRHQGVELVMDSRTSAFATDVLPATDGRGVDVVLNSLIGDAIPRGLDALAPGGRFVELGKREVWSADEVAALRPDVGYHTVPLAEDIVERPAEVGARLRRLMAAVDAGELQPLPTQTFALGDAASAFRFMAQARHIGKVVLVCPEAADEGPGETVVREDGTYLVTGGLGGLGLLVAGWLADRGARYLALIGRHEPNTASREAIRAIEEKGVEVRVLTADVSCRRELAAALDEVLAHQPPLRGVIHAAGILDDASLLNQDWARFAAVLAPKLDGAWNLHELTAGQPLDHFVLFSSAASLFGSAGQANHAAANAFLDALAVSRRAHGQPGLSINWGGWAGVGAVVTHGVEDRIEARGLSTMRPDAALDALGRLMAQGRPQVAVLPINWPVFLRRLHGVAATTWLIELAQQAAAVDDRGHARRAGPEAGGADRAIRDRLAAAAPAEQEQLLLDFVSAQVARVLGAGSPAGIGEREPLHELGLDSLMAVELRNLLGAGLGLDEALPATLVFDHPTVQALEAYLSKVVLGGPERAPSTVLGEPCEHDDLLASIELMSDDDVARLIGD